MPQILENWCLVHYCTLTDRSNYKIHWTDELRGHILTASRFSIKGNDSSEARLKVLTEVIDENDYTDPQFLNLTIVNKFIKEKIDTSSETYGQVLEDCITYIQSICDAILSRDKDQITIYVRNI